jgi:integrase
VGVPYTLEAIRRGINTLPQLINKERAKAGKVASMPVINFRDLRHTCHILIRLDVHPKIISERLGHTSIKITMDTCGYLMTGMQYAAVEAINKAVVQTAVQENKQVAAPLPSPETAETRSA